MASENTLYSAQVCYFIGRLGSLLENSENTSIGVIWGGEKVASLA